MPSIPPIHLLSVLHLVCLSLWGGVVATEAVIELYSFRQREMHPVAIRLHFWIDLWVELPLLLAVAGTGVVLAAMAWPLSTTHLIKIGCGAGAIAANLVCVVLVLRRGRQLKAGASDAELWRTTRRIVGCAAAGLPLAATAAVLGLGLAHERMTQLLS